jgi:hypothetical protein
VDGDSQYEMVSTRDGLDYKERKVMEPKNTTWRKLILAEVLEVSEMTFCKMQCCRSGVFIPDPDGRKSASGSGSGLNNPDHIF